MSTRSRKTVKVSDVRAYTNRVLAASDDDLTGDRRGVAMMYERIAMDANDYHGYNDLVRVSDSAGTYIPDKSYRRFYYGEMTGEYAGSVVEAVANFKVRMPNDEHRRRTLCASERDRDAGRYNLAGHGLPLDPGLGRSLVTAWDDMPQTGGYSAGRD
jgi:hypothetical protein